MRTKVVLAGALAALAVAGGCGFADNSRPGVEVPSFEATVRSPTAIDVLTQATAPEDLRMIFDQVDEDRSDGDWYEVTIRCASVSADSGVDATLAVGRFANTYRGADEAGLPSPDHVTFEATGRGCEPLTSDVPGTVTYEEVRAAVRAAGLPVLSERDGSDACAELDCVDRDVTDQFTVIVWPDGEAAERWSLLATVDVVRLGPVTTAQLNETGFAPGSPERERYEAAIRGAAPGEASGDLTEPAIVPEPGA
jgi:hypothetical protein